MIYYYFDIFLRRRRTSVLAKSSQLLLNFRMSKIGAKGTVSLTFRGKLVAFLGCVVAVLAILHFDECPSKGHVLSYLMHVGGYFSFYHTRRDHQEIRSIRPLSVLRVYTPHLRAMLVLFASVWVVVPFMYTHRSSFILSLESSRPLGNLSQVGRDRGGKVLISGTGRGGTTFLILLFTFLDLDTGFTRHNYSESIFQNCGSGMEKSISSPNRFLKNPNFMTDINQILDKGNAVSSVIIPIRNYTLSAFSRYTHQTDKGGLWGGASDVPSQEAYYHKILAEYLVSMVQRDTATVFLDFERMVTDDLYLFGKLRSILPPTISPGTFKQAFQDAASASSKRASKANAAPST